MHLGNIHYHFWAGDFNPLLMSKQPESQEMVLKTLKYTTLHSILVTDIPKDYSCSLGRWKIFSTSWQDAWCVCPDQYTLNLQRCTDQVSKIKPRRRSPFVIWAPSSTNWKGLAAYHSLPLHFLYIFTLGSSSPKENTPLKNSNLKNYLDFQATREKKCYLL